MTKYSYKELFKNIVELNNKIDFLMEQKTRAMDIGYDHGTGNTICKSFTFKELYEERKKAK